MRWHETLGRFTTGWFWLLALVVAFGPALARADTLKVGSTGAALGMLDRLAGAFREAQSTHSVVVVRPSVGSNGAILGVSRGDLELGLSSHPLKESEKAQGVVEEEIGRSSSHFASDGENSLHFWSEGMGCTGWCGYEAQIGGPVAKMRGRGEASVRFLSVRLLGCSVEGYDFLTGTQAAPLRVGEVVVFRTRASPGVPSTRRRSDRW